MEGRPRAIKSLQQLLPSIITDINFTATAARVILFQDIAFRSSLAEDSVNRSSKLLKITVFVIKISKLDHH